MRVAVTGIASDFGTVVAPLLFADAGVGEVIGVPEGVLAGRQA